MLMVTAIDCVIATMIFHEQSPEYFRTCSGLSSCLYIFKKFNAHEHALHTTQLVHDDDDCFYYFQK